MDCLQTVSELYMIIISASFPLNEPTKYKLVCASLLYVGMITLQFLWRGMPDMPHSFGREATNWLRGIWSSCK